MINEKIKNYGLYSYGAVETEEQLKKPLHLQLWKYALLIMNFIIK